MKKTVKIGEKNCEMKTSAALPRIYRLAFGRDIFEDVYFMTKTFSAAAASLQNKEIQAPSEKDQMEASTIFENLTYAMHKHGDPKQPDSVEEWLGQFDDEAALMSSSVVMQIMDLWNHETETTAEAKKKKDQSTGE